MTSFTMSLFERYSVFTLLENSCRNIISQAPKSGVLGIQNLFQNANSQHQSCIIEQTTDKGASSWLNALPLENQDFNLNKAEFIDALRLRYDIPLENLPSTCACGERFDVNHALPVKKAFICHTKIRYLARYFYCTIKQSLYRCWRCTASSAGNEWDF